MAGFRLYDTLSSTWSMLLVLVVVVLVLRVVPVAALSVGLWTSAAAVIARSIPPSKSTSVFRSKNSSSGCL